MLIVILDVLLAAFASLYVWVFVSQLTTPIIAPVQRWLRRGWRRSLVSCPWCTSFWLALLFILLLQMGRYDWVATPLAVLAAAAISAFIGSMTPGILDEDED